MLGLLDIAPPEISAEEVDIRGTKVPVQGLPAEEWARLYARFPEYREVVAGKRDERDLSLIARVRWQAALIAAGLGKPGDRPTERRIMDRLTLEDQNVFVQAIMRLSLPGAYLGPLLDEEGVVDRAALSTAA